MEVACTHGQARGQTQPASSADSHGALQEGPATHSRAQPADEGVVGVFDSGIGGLTVLSELRRLLPEESTVYLGDALRCPYGPRPRDEVRGFAVQIARFLAQEYRLKLLVVACNTASASALPDVQAAAPDVPVLGVIGPGAQAAVQVSPARRIGVIATAGTVGSHAYQRAVQQIAPGAVIVEQACPQLVPLVESGQTESAEAERWVRHYLAPLFAARVDTLILGCTHYPLLRPVLARVVAGRMQIVDSAATTAVQAQAILQARGMLACGEGASGG